jgi:hypothetical protein
MMATTGTVRSISVMAVVHLADGMGRPVDVVDQPHR